MNESSTVGDTDFLEHLVPRLMIQTVMMSEMTYINMLESMEQLLLQLQQRNIFAKEQCEKLASSPVINEIKQSLLWTKSQNDLLRYENQAYVPNDLTVKAEIK